MRDEQMGHETRGLLAELSLGAVGRGWLRAGFLSIVIAVPVLLAAAPAALAGTVTDERPLLFTFDGSDASAGRLASTTKIAIDNSTGDVYVVDEGRKAVDRFDADGEAEAFSAIASSSLTGFTNEIGVAVDNSIAHPGRLYVSQFSGGLLRAFDPEGHQLCAFSAEKAPGDVAVDSLGNPWLTPRGTSSPVVQYASTGCPFGQLSTFPSTSNKRGIEVDANGNVYIVTSGEVVEKYTGGVKGTNLDTGARDVYANQTSLSGHLFTVRAGNFAEWSSAGTLVKAYGGSGEYIRYGKGIAYNPTRDWVYVTQQNAGETNPVVSVFGPAASGTVPDVTEIKAVLSGEEISTAHFSGKVNPRNVSAKAHFEWKRPSESWAAAATSPPQALPVDETEHAVEFDTNRLRGNTTYQVRLVTINSGADGLRAFSSEVKEFTTVAATEAPAVTIDSVAEVPTSPCTTAITTESACVSGTINPKGDSADWRVQLQPACSGSFSDQALQTIAGSNTSVPVAYVLKGLLPSERYCVRITAINSFGTTTSAETKEFETHPIAPDQIETAFVAPRLDTSARLNGRVNPEGEELTYYFEYSEDGGGTWIKLPPQVNNDEARGQILVAEELENLTPNTEYLYRFVVENPAGSAMGVEKTFITRTTAEVTSPQSCPNEDVRQGQHSDAYLADCRAIELVNNPDKGNQNLFSQIGQPVNSMMTADGETAFWSVTGGAPGGTASAGNFFLAERTESGWHSRNLVPPAAQQFGNGNWPYGVEKATPDLGAFIFTARDPSTIALAEGKALIRLDRDQHQEVLANYEHPVNGGNSEVSDDGAHVLIINPDNKQLEDVGDPGNPELVSLMTPPGSPLGVPQPGGSPSACGLDTTGASFSGTSPAGGAGAHWIPGYRRIAAEDASRVYFEAKPDSNCSGPFGLYERNRETNATTLIDPGTPSKNVEIIRATPDGRSAYFATFSQLDPADQNTGADVYRWDEETGESTCLTCVVPNANIAFFNTSLLPILVSDDFSHVYFQSEAQLVPNHGKAGALNTYVLSGGTIRFVAGEGVGRLGISGKSPQALLSPNGNVLVFEGKTIGGAQSLTTDTLASQCASSGGELGPCQELYRYDDRDGSLECISCSHDGETTFSAEPGAQFRMSADGRTVAFVTSQPLLARDVNQGTDIYEWRDGTVHLISDGVRSFPGGLTPPEVRGVDADGQDILFALVAPGLTGFEQDGQRNLYDARIDGGFMPPSPLVHCAEDSCQGPLQGAPALEGPASANESRGNLVESTKPRHPCAKKRGKARRRCIKKHKRRLQQARASHNVGRTR
jgi:hypothetical protein